MRETHLYVLYRNTAIGAFDYITVLWVVCKDCKSVASNTGKIIDRDQKKKKKDARVLP